MRSCVHQLRARPRAIARGNLDEVLAASILQTLPAKSLSGAEQLMEPRARVGQSDAGARARGRVLPRAVIADGEMQGVAMETRADRDPAAAFVALDGVAYGVLHDWEQNERGDAKRFDLRRDLDGHGEPISEAHALDLEILACEFHFFGEGNLRFAIAGQREPKEVAELRDHPRGLGGAHFDDEGGDCVERIKEEVRVDLVAKRLQSCLARERLGLEAALARGAQGSVLREAEVEQAPGDEHERAVPRAAESIERQPNEGRVLAGVHDYSRCPIGDAAPRDRRRVRRDDDGGDEHPRARAALQQLAIEQSKQQRDANARADEWRFRDEHASERQRAEPWQEERADERAPSESLKEPELPTCAHGESPECESSTT